MRSSHASLLSNISDPMGTDEERLSGETIALKNEIRILRQTPKKVLHEVPLNWLQSFLTITMQQPHIVGYGGCV